MKSSYLQVLAPVLTLILQVVATCNDDNCLRAFQGKSVTASSFCATWNGVSSALPTYASACSYLPSRISSACSCLGTITSSSSTSSTSSSSTSSLTLPPTTCPVITTITSTTTVSVTGGATTVTDDSTTTDFSTLPASTITVTPAVVTITDDITLPAVTSTISVDIFSTASVTVTVTATATVTSVEGLQTCSCSPTPTPILNPSYEEGGADWTIASSQTNLTVVYASEYDDELASSGSYFLVAIIPQSDGFTGTALISQVIDLCSGEGRYIFSVDATLISPVYNDQACFVTAFAYQGTGPPPPPAGNPQTWTSGQVYVGSSSWSTITFGVPYVNSGSGTAWTLLAEIQCLINPGVELTGIVGLDNWQVEYQSLCVTTEVLVPA